jgi:hypothetical protein
MIGRGQCLFSLTALSLRAMITYYLFVCYRIWGELKRWGFNPN